ncbi:protein rogdi homolog isoform X1 [Hydra vulgaris]|uniref:Protein rogdi homolog n=1 Tax=Hydra vulgaris TaxID=6087 RepID=T2M6C0_HYDVU|nr:protein rogdi homolog isoform X1 [Hydra vulgaris]
MSSKVNVLRLEFNWLLTDEVSSILAQLKEIIQSCLSRFKMPLGMSATDTSKGSNLPFNNSELVKGWINVAGEHVMKAELKFKIPKFGSAGIGTFIFEQCPWKLQQLLETHNHLQMAFDEILERECCGKFTSGEQVEELMNTLMGSLNRAKTCMLVPEKLVLAELFNSSQQRVFNPSIPEELIIFFNVNCDKVVLSVYVLNSLTSAPSQKVLIQDQSTIGHQFETHNKWYEVINKAEVICSVPWLKDLIVWINTALQLCQQLKDKIAIFHTLLPDLVLKEDSD